MQCSKPIEYTCWILSAIIMIILGFIICSEWKTYTPSNSVSGRKSSGRRSRAEPKQAKPQNDTYDESGSFMIPPSSTECVDESRQSDTSHFYTDSGEDIESYKKTDMKEALSKTNHRADILAKSDTGSPHEVPSRTKGSSTVPWMQLMSCNQKQRTHSNTEIAFNGSSHLDAARGAM